MKRYYRPKTLGRKLITGESVFYIILDDSPQSVLTDPVVPYVARHAMKPVTRGNMTLVVNN